jgi:23S rRNA (cytidine2498-2'-O)-methyltransferase
VFIDVDGHRLLHSPWVSFTKSSGEPYHVAKCANGRPMKHSGDKLEQPLCVPAVYFSADETTFSAAEAELSEAFPDADIERIGPDTGCLCGEGIEIADVAAACTRRPIVFVRQLMRGLAELPSATAATDLGVVSQTALDLLREHDAGAEVALQVWRSGDAVPGVRTDELWRHLAGRLADQGFAISRGNRPRILSVLITDRATVIGLNRRQEALVDWPGGRLSLAKPADQVSRSEFKLEELFKVCDLPLPSHGVALDLGAAPGGWTRLLRRRGFSVWAVDPADLDPRVASDPDVHHVRTTSAVFLAETKRRFDLVVNDMRMTPTRSCDLMLEAARHLEPDGLAIVTLKLSSLHPLKTVRACLGILQRGYDLLVARQLYHNRHEVTVVARLRAPIERQRTRNTRRPTR